MKNIGIVALAAVAALVLGFGARLGSVSTAHADATDMQIIGCELLAGGADGDLTNATTGADYVAVGCTGGAITPATIANLDEAYGDGDGTLTPSDLADQDALDGNQIAEDCTAAAVQCTLIAFVYVDDEAAVTVDPPAGLETTEAGSIDYVCDTEAEDADCDDTTPNNGDGVVTAHIINATGSAGDVDTVNATQETIEVNSDVNVVGVADNVTIALAESTIQTSGVSADVAACKTDNDVTDSLGEPNVTIAIVTVTDSDDNPVARVSATVTSSDTDIAAIGTGTPGEVTGNTGQTVVADVGTAQYVVICGGTDTGDADIKAAINPSTGPEDDTATVTVVGAPDAVALTAAPAAIACDGSQTATVTAKVTDSEGNNVANGVNVNFSVVALGTANPINAKTVDGSASTVITPLSGATAGVTVIVTSGDAQSSIRVDCSLPVPTATAPGGVVPTATPPGGVRPPDTGNGGYLGQDSSAGFPLWTLVALVAGGFALLAGGAVTRKVSK